MATEESGGIRTASVTESNAMKIFISYRRADTRGYAGWLEHCLEETLDPDHVFRDIADLRAGEDFMTAIRRFISQCDAVLCLIGPRWVGANGGDGQTRLEAEDDPVRIELETALKMGRRVIPVLVDDAQMPDVRNLPGSLAELCRINAFRLSDARWKSDVQQLLNEVSRLKEQGGTRQWLPGWEIYTRFRDNDRPPTWVGRAGGAGGTALERDLRHGRWKKAKFEIRFKGPLPGRNWFPTARFVEMADEAMAKRAEARTSKQTGKASSDPVQSTPRSEVPLSANPPETGRVAPESSAGLAVADELRRIGAHNILVMAAEAGYLTEFGCGMDECLCPEELGGRQYFDSETPDHWHAIVGHRYVDKEDGGHRTVDNVVLSHKLCDRVKHSKKIGRSDEKDRANAEVARQAALKRR